MQKDETALLFATQRKEVHIVNELMKAGADPNFKTEVSLKLKNFYMLGKVLSTHIESHFCTDAFSQGGKL